MRAHDAARPGRAAVDAVDAVDVVARRRAAVMVTLALAVAGVLSVVAPVTTVVAVVAQLVVVAVCVPAARWCRRAARAVSGRASTAWHALGAATALWAAGNVVTVVSVALPGRGINAGIYPVQALAMVAVLVALVAMPRPRWSPGGAPRAWLDVAVLVAAVGLLASVTLVDDVRAGADGLDLVFALLYPAASTVMLGAAYELGRRHVYPPRPELALLSAAFGVWLVTAALYSLTPAPYVAPAWISWGVTVGVVMLALSARRVVRRVVGREPDSVELGSRVAKVVLAAPDVAVVVAAVAAIAAGLSGVVEQVLAALVALLVVARHVVVTSDARRFHWRLEREVADRTTELRTWSERYAGILDAVGDGIVGTDALGRITYTNAAARRLLGADEESLLGRDACHALCPQRRHDCPFETALTGAPVLGRPTELRDRDGSPRPVELHVVPQPDGDDGAPGGLVVAVRDVAAQLAVEQVKRQFVSSVSHELRTPLTSVRGVLEMFVDGDAGELSPVGRDLVANASRGVERLSRLVDDIIDAEKLASGQFRVRPVALELAHVVHQTATTLEPLASGAEVDIEADVAPGLVVWGDPDRIEQALVNLVGNAVKFSPPGSTVHLGARPGVEPGTVVVGVRDHGPGIPADELDQVFERFHQVAGADRRAHGGTGLGLTITRSIVEQHGGRVWVESTLGDGALFCFTLPRADATGRREGVVPAPRAAIPER